MKTWEMIKELTENPEKKFIKVVSEYPRMVGVSVVTGSVVYLRDGKPNGVVELYQLLNEEWKEVKESVDFMTAFKAFRENKTIYVKDGELKSGAFTYYPSELNSQYQAFSEEDIANGEWYIED